MKVWVVGKLISEGWMCEGIFYQEEDAINNSKENEFIAEVRVDERLPSDVKDCLCIYWPRLQKKEEGISNLNKYRLNIAD